VLAIRVVASASLQIEEAANWWTTNPTSAPLVFVEDLRQAFDLISQQPEIGAATTNVSLVGVRRVYLARLRYFLYYRVQPSHVEILALWYTSRGTGPEV
jgi:plasmid stabilization system protein ParE